MTLEEYEVSFNHIVLDDAMDEYGLIRHQLTSPDRKPLTDDLQQHERDERDRRIVAGQKWHPLLGTAAYGMYEDANYVGNRYLISQVWRSRATENTISRDDARRAYEASLYPYREGIKIEKGYWPKPYGALKGEYAIDKIYTETSLDQAYSPVIALWRYYQYLADDAEKKEIGEALQAHAHWWIRHDYNYDYLGEKWNVFDSNMPPFTANKISSPSEGLKIPIGMHIAYQVTGDKQLLDECVRIMRKGIADGGVKMHRGPRGEIKELYHWAEIYDYFMRDTALCDEADWPRLIKECWRAAKSTVQEDGLCIGMGNFMDDGRIEKYEPGPAENVDHCNYWKTDAPHPASTTQMACLAMLIQELGYDADAGSVGKKLLSAVAATYADGYKPLTIDGYLYSSREQMPPSHREKPPIPIFDTRTAVFWLDAYWRGKLQGIL